jgi:hypothetical protein
MYYTWSAWEVDAIDNTPLDPYNRVSSKGDNMAKNAKKFPYLETWNTRYGVQERVVIRTASGKFVDSVNLTSLRKAKPVTTR